MEWWQREVWCTHLLWIVFGKDSITVKLLQHILQLLRGVCGAKGEKNV